SSPWRWDEPKDDPAHRGRALISPGSSTPQVVPRATVRSFMSLPGRRGLGRGVRSGEVLPPGAVDVDGGNVIGCVPPSGEDVVIRLEVEGDLGAVGRERRIPVVGCALREALDAGAVEVADVDVAWSASAVVADGVDPGQLRAVRRERGYGVL